jgi:FkbM family methyltransferase
MILSVLRKLRHGPLRFLGPFWTFCGGAFRGLLGRSGLFVRQSVGDYGPFYLDIRFAFSNFSAWGADRHNDGFDACIKEATGMNCVLDIGAHIGLVSLPMASVVAPGGTVISFEPSKANRELLKRHAKRNGFSDVIVIEDKLVGAQNESGVDFYELNGASGMNSAAPGAVGNGYNLIPKDQVTLDDYCAENNLKPQLIKIDVEGAEIDVLKGAVNIIRQEHPTIFLSFHPRHVSQMGYSADDLVNLLKDYNYSCRHVDGTPVEEFKLREYVLAPEV